MKANIDMQKKSILLGLDVGNKRASKEVLMGAKIYNSAQFYKKMQVMQKSGGKASDAAAQALKIIRELAERPDLSMILRNKLTTRGDARIEKCFKFDLGSGYRLVYIKKGGWFVFLFLGTHDECDTWMNNNAGLQPDINKAEVVNSRKESLCAGKQELHSEKAIDWNEKDIPLHHIVDQKTLEEIFRGISGVTEE